MAVKQRKRALLIYGKNTYGQTFKHLQGKSLSILQHKTGSFVVLNEKKQNQTRQASQHNEKG